MTHLQYGFSGLFNLINGLPCYANPPQELTDPVLAFSNILLYKKE